jgi:aspartate aminotransferase
MRPMPSRRVLAITESQTLAIDAAAKALKAQGESVVSFGAGEPDFATPAHIVEAAIEACRHVPDHRYTPGPGLPELRAAIAEKTRRDSRLDVSAAQVLVTNGGKHALFNAFTSLIDDGDEVMLPAPYWVSYPEMISLCGGRVVPLLTTEETGFKVTVDKLEAARSERTKALVFVSPSNPTGAVYSPEEVLEIGRWAVDTGTWVVTDEIYEHLVYGDSTFSSLPVVVPEARERCIVVNGVAKSYAMTGWRVGWMIGPPEVVTAAISLQSHCTSNVSNVAQAAALAAVAGDLEAVANMRVAFDRRRLTMTKMLNDIEGVTCVEPQGAFYCFPSFEGLLGRTIAGEKPTSSLELAGLVLDQAKVALVPGEAFGAPGYARLSYALSDDDLVEGLRRLGELLG